jgi:glycosyltransferase involved in cell wall biosynthesis/tRNA A-37 threonylcarbamoyl transferase component Bud32
MPRAEARREPWLRGSVAVLVSRFPKITETFILREIVEMERQGQAVRLVALVRERPRVVHPEAEPWLDRLLHLPPFSPEVAAANLRALAHRPGRWLGLAARLLAGTWRRPVVALRTLALFPVAVALAERLAAEGVAHIHAAFATYPATAAWVIRELSGIGFSFSVHAHDLFVHQLLLREKLAAARFVRAISEFNAGLLARLAPESAGRIEVIRVGIDMEGRWGASAPPPGEPVVLAVAALEQYKGLPVLIDACALLARRGVPFRCEIVGRGRERHVLEQRIRARGLVGRVELLGARIEGEVACLMRGATVVVQPSVVAADGQMEGIPVALMEAMAAGRPVVASRLSGIPELVEPGHQGLLVPSGDADALAEAIARLLADGEEAARMGRAGVARVGELHDLAATTAALLARLDRELEPRDGGGLLAAAGGIERASVRAVVTRADSEISLLSAAGPLGIRELVLKRHRTRAGESAPAAERARREHALLEELARRAPALGAPRALAFDAEAATLLLETCAGERLDLRLRRLRAGDPRALAGDLERAGRWLAEFQRAFPAAGSGAERLEELRAGSAGGAPSAAVDPSTLRRVRTHGDFWPGNLFVSDSGVQAIDFEGTGTGLAEEDAADFLVELRLFFLRPGGRARFRAAAAAFLSGWGGGDNEILEHCLRWAALRRMAESPAGVPAPVRALRRRALYEIARGRGVAR